MRLLRRLPAAGWACAAIAVLNGVAWAVITPPYWAPDEYPSVGYSQYIAETGQIPKFGRVGALSGEESLAYGKLRFSPESRPTWSERDSRELFSELGSGRLSREREGQAEWTINNPPLYYALEAIPYRLAYSSNFLDRLFFMRLLSALLAGVTVACVFLFLRELLPRTPWAWTVGSLAVAFQPMLGFMAGGVNNDNLLYACSAGLFFLVARAFRRGLTLRRGAAIGAVVAAGLLTKQTIFGLVPGAALALGLMAWRARAARQGGPAGDGAGIATANERARRVARAAGVAVGVAAIPYFLWLVVSSTLLDRSASATSGITSEAVERVATVSGQLSYLWQAFLPKLPFMNDFLPHYVPWEIYFKGFVGRFGWAQFTFPTWAHLVAAAAFAAVAVLAARALWRERRSLLARWPEAVCYASMVAGLLLVIEVAAYRHLVTNSQLFEQGRYLLPLLALYGAVIALAARGAGSRLGPVVGAFLVVLAMGHSLFAQLLTIARFYG